MPKILVLKDINIITSLLYHTKHTQQSLYNNINSITNDTITKNSLRADAIPLGLGYTPLENDQMTVFIMTWSNSPQCVLPST